MRRADIEVPNTPVDVDSWGVSACYPRGSFYPLSDGPSTRYHRITKPDFRPCSTCLSRSQAPFCLYTLRAISVRTEGTFGRLRYLLNSRLGLFTAAIFRWHPFSRSYGVILPSSLTIVLSLTLGFSPHLPVSVCGTGTYGLASGFS